VSDQDLAPFRGAIEQVPPDYAAVKVGGRTAYSRARAGEKLELSARTVTIERLEIASWQPPDLRVLVVCSSGTYIRSLARDLARSLGSAGHLGGLRRLAVGALVAESSPGIEALRSMGREAALGALRAPGDDALVLDDRFRKEPADRLLADWEA
jgi:tRNA pseudouridine55 synthase